MAVEYIFIKYLLIPILVAVALAGFAIYAKAKTALRPGRLMFYILIQAVVIASPCLLGLLTYQFVPFGLIATQVSFFLIGILAIQFTSTKLFQSIGLEDNKLITFLCFLVSLLLGGWGFFLLFEYLSDLSYSIWVALAAVWFFFPIFYQWGKEAFNSIAPAYYQVWDPLETGRFDDGIWENADYLRMMNISLRIKQSREDRAFSSYPVRAPVKVPIAQWFKRYIKDQRVKFPNSPIEMEDSGEYYSWMFYTTRFLIFNRAISPEKTFEDYRIRNKSIVYARRVEKSVHQK